MFKPFVWCLSSCARPPRLTMDPEHLSEDHRVPKSKSRRQRSRSVRQRLWHSLHGTDTHGASSCNASASLELLNSKLHFLEHLVLDLHWAALGQWGYFPSCEAHIAEPSDIHCDTQLNAVLKSLQSPESNLDADCPLDAVCHPDAAGTLPTCVNPKGRCDLQSSPPAVEVGGCKQPETAHTDTGDYTLDCCLWVERPHVTFAPPGSKTSNELQFEAAVLIQKFFRRRYGNASCTLDLRCTTCDKLYSRDVHGLLCTSACCSGGFFYCTYCWKDCSRCHCTQPHTKAHINLNYECAACNRYCNQSLVAWCANDGYGCTSAQQQEMFHSYCMLQPQCQSSLHLCWRCVANGNIIQTSSDEASAAAGTDSDKDEGEGEINEETVHGHSGAGNPVHNEEVSILSSQGTEQDNPSVRDLLRTLQGRLDFVLNFLGAIDAGSLPFAVPLEERVRVGDFLRSTLAWVSEFRSKAEFKSKIAEVDDYMTCLVKRHQT